MREVRHHFPGIAPWVEWCYLSPTHLFFNDGELLASQTGVQQGDPLGPLLFSLALRCILPDVAAVVVEP